MILSPPYEFAHTKVSGASEMARCTQINSPSVTNGADGSFYEAINKHGQVAIWHMHIRSIFWATMLALKK